jgi:hypothetical protein
MCSAPCRQSTSNPTIGGRLVIVKASATPSQRASDHVCRRNPVARSCHRRRSVNAQVNALGRVSGTHRYLLVLTVGCPVRSRSRCTTRVPWSGPRPTAPPRGAPRRREVPLGFSVGLPSHSRVSSLLAAQRADDAGPSKYPPIWASSPCSPLPRLASGAQASLRWSRFAVGGVVGRIRPEGPPRTGPSSCGRHRIAALAMCGSRTSCGPDRRPGLAGGIAPFPQLGSASAPHPRRSSRCPLCLVTTLTVKLHPPRWMPPPCLSVSSETARSPSRVSL